MARTKTRRAPRSSPAIDAPGGSPPFSLGRPATFGFAAAILVAFAVLSVFSYTQKSATWDEPLHLAHGYAALTRHDFRVDPGHPPLMRMLAALPLLAVPSVTVETSTIDETAPIDWRPSGQSNLGHRFLYRDNDADRLLYRARFMSVMAGVLLGLLVFFWAQEWLGSGAALLALAFTVFEPNIAAHFSLVTTDAAFTCFAFGTIYFLWRAGNRFDAANIGGCAVLLGMAVATKFTALVLGPIIVALLLVSVFWLRTMSPRQACLFAGVLAVTAWCAIWAAYGFRYAPGPMDTWLFRYHEDPSVLERVPAVLQLVKWIDERHLLPNAFSQGILITQAYAQVRYAFLAGAYSDTGWWYFFPVAILIKTPVSLLALAGSGLLHVRNASTRNGAAVVFVLVPILVFLVAAMASRINIGLRHVLMVYPFLALLAAFACKALLERKRGAIVVAAVAIWSLEFGRVYPDMLAFFNALVGGPAHGAEYLVDSSLDWGQDLKPLKRWMDDKGLTEINLAYFGSADPAYYGIQPVYLPGSESYVPIEQIKAPRLPGYVAISATLLTGVLVDESRRDFYKPLLARTPEAIIGHSINVYWIDRPWWN